MNIAERKLRHANRAVSSKPRRRELEKAVYNWIGIVCICAMVLVVLSPLAYEGIMMSVSRHGVSLWGWWPVLVPIPVLYFIIALSTGRVVQKTVDYRAPTVTADNLPAEDVLVRMAAEPSAPIETLLRATVKDEETKPEELLRSSQGG